jgi:hypothetical protein
MKNNIRKHPWYIALLLVIILALLSAGVGLASGNIDTVEKWIWGTNIGWVNFNTPNSGVTVYSDHLEGYAWGENIGWIRLGSYEGGGAHTYANTNASNYGVNRSNGGDLSGFAWGTNVGWINFDPPGGGVSFDPVNGESEGYAWGENVGWIKFSGEEYGLNTSFREFYIYLPILSKP